MWCVAELDEEYIAGMEDVLAVYEKPLSVQEPVVCIDEKTGGTPSGSSASGSHPAGTDSPPGW